MRRLVAISQADATLTKMLLPWSAIAVRATSERASSPESHQRKACVSSRSRMPLFPGRQLLFRQRFKKLRPDADDSTQRSESTRDRRGPERHDLGDRLLASRQDDLLASLHACEKLRQICLRIVNRDDCHGDPLAR